MGGDAEPLAEADVSQFWDRGYLLVKGVLTRDEAAHYRRTILDLVPRDLTIPEHWLAHSGRLKPIRQPSDRAPGISPDTWDITELLPLLFHEHLYAVAAQVLGTEKLRVSDGSLGITLRNVSDDGPLSQPVHLDPAVPTDRDNFQFTIEETMVGGCYYLSDVERDGGGIHVVPGGPRLVEHKARSHPKGRSLYQNWKRIHDFPSTVEITGEAGDFVMHHHLMPHAASHNRRPTPRVVQFTRFVRHDHPHGATALAPPGRYNERQLQAMTPVGRRLLGVDPW